MSRCVFMLLVTMWAAPAVAFAAVSISEIAWMGLVDSPNDEWIELYNSGPQAAVVDGWILEDGVSLSIPLSGSIESGQYAVLERTDDTSAPGDAFLIYTGALANTGATLVLRDAGGIIVDQVAGGENWEAIGGNNVTKDTAQYTTGGWITAPATPGDPNATEASPDTDADTSAAESPATQSTGSAIMRTLVKPPTLIPSTNELALSIVAPASAYLKRSVEFEAKASGIGDSITDSLVYSWNFGDMSTAFGKTVSHTYTHPGEYIVTLRAAYARHDVVTQHPITILPVRFSITRALSGDIQIHNESPYDVDVSDYTLVGNTTITFPKLSFLPTKGTVTVSAARLGGQNQGQIQLRDRTGTLLAAYTNGLPPATTQTRAAALPDNQIAPVTNEPAESSFLFSRPAATSAASSTGSASEVSLVQPNPSASVVAAGPKLPEVAWPLFGLVSIIAIGLASVYTGSRQEVHAEQNRNDVHV